MKRLFITLLALIGFLPAFATHIVGGGFTMLSEGNYQYKFQLTLYFDEINGNPAALDDGVVFTIFSKAGNLLIEKVIALRAPDIEYVPYQYSYCAGQSLTTRIYTYETTIQMSPSVYNHPEGYYVAWERCCRNHIITNIIDPENTSGMSGQYFPDRKSVV